MGFCIHGYGGPTAAFSITLLGLSMASQFASGENVCVSVCVCVGDVGKVILEMLELEIVKIEITQIVGLF